jgi:asparagine synthetase B (glutamine-hydrolysing)
MCGLAGIFTADIQKGDVAERASGMGAALRHRGPDDEGLWFDQENGIALAFRRLSIIDLSADGHQPMQSHSRRFAMVFNGEVYNYRELRHELEQKGSRFIGHSDTEVILAAFETWGIETSLRRFIGMFAMAIWDRAERERCGHCSFTVLATYVRHNRFGCYTEAIRTGRESGGVTSLRDRAGLSMNVRNHHSKTIQLNMSTE